MNEIRPETITCIYPDALAPAGSHIRLGGRDLLILEVQHARDGVVLHLCLVLEAPEQRSNTARW